MKDCCGPIAVTAVGGGVGQSVLRALRLSGLPWQVIGLDIDARAAGLYVCDQGHLVPPASDPGYGDRLRHVLAQAGARLLIPGSDPEVSAIARHREALRDAGIVPIVGSPEAVRFCRDKLAGSQFFHAHGFPFARTVPACEAMELASQVGFPLIAKPSGGSASRGAVVVFDEPQLQRCLTQPGMIVQEYLVPDNWHKSRVELGPHDVAPGGLLRQEDEISTQVLFDHEGQLLGQFTSRNVLKQGVPVFIDPCREPLVEDLARRMGLLLVQHGMVGPCNFQCKLTAAGPIFFEVNPRFTGITAVRAATGFNEVEAVLRRALLDEPLPEVAARLRASGDVVCSRYITELLIPRNQLQQVCESARVSGHASSTSMAPLTSVAATAAHDQSSERPPGGGKGA